VKKTSRVNNLQELQMKVNTSWNPKIYYCLRVRTDAANTLRPNERFRTAEHGWSFSFLRNLKTGHVVVFYKNFND